MATFIEYELEDGLVILIQAPSEERGGIVESSLGGSKKIKARERFHNALQAAKLQAKELLNEIKELDVIEAEIKFGLVTTGELGVFAIGKVGLDVNYEVTLKWKNPLDSEKK